MITTYNPTLQDLWFRQQFMADEATIQGVVLPLFLLIMGVQVRVIFCVHTYRSSVRQLVLYVCTRRTAVSFTYSQ